MRRILEDLKDWLRIVPAFAFLFASYAFGFLGFALSTTALELCKWANSMGKDIRHDRARRLAETKLVIEAEEA